MGRMTKKIQDNSSRVGGISREQAEAAEEWEAKDPFRRDDEGNILPGQDVGNHFDDVLDELHSTQGNASHVSQEERDAVERWEQQFLHALKAECTVRLSPQGVVALDASLDRTDGDSFLVTFTEKAARHRRHDVRLTLNECLSHAHASEEMAGREIIDIVCRRALEARDAYHARMH